MFSYDNNDLARIERKLDLLLDHFGIDHRVPMPAEAQRHIDEGQKIRAIKAYREATGAGLKDAKNAVERARTW